MEHWLVMLSVTLESLTYWLPRMAEFDGMASPMWAMQKLSTKDSSLVVLTAGPLCVHERVPVWRTE